MSQTTANASVIRQVAPLGAPPWPTLDPFLFCVHHLDVYPAGNEHMGPNASLAGRQIGMDFEGKDGWRMYHGDVIPGFPQHPHRGFETITLARRGFIDHSDSLGATARFGHGDVQWMTAGRGIVHSEMFPLVHRDRENPTELFQIWMNLPAANKMVEPHFEMLWDHTIPKVELHQGGLARVAVIAGSFSDAVGPKPPPNSWAAGKDSAVRILTIVLEAGAELTLPVGAADANRVLYVFGDAGLAVGDERIPRASLAALRAEVPAAVRADQGATELLLLEGRPIGEPVAQYGPFVMNTSQEIQRAMADYHRTQFGGWPWPTDAPVHAREAGRFAVHADGRRDQPDP